MNTLDNFMLRMKWNGCSRQLGRFRRLGILVGVLLFGIFLNLADVAQPVAAAGTSSESALYGSLLEPEGKKPRITVDANKTLGSIDSDAFGLIMSNKGNSVPELMHFFRTPEGQAELADLGTRSLYYWTDRDHWAYPSSSYTAELLQYPSTLLTDEFMILAQAVGADPMIAVNITTLCKQANPLMPPSPANVTCKNATPAIAKSWLEHIKTLGIANVKYVALGIEPYAGCAYWTSKKGINCTTRNKQHKIALTQDEYVKRIKKWGKMLRKLDPTIEIGVHLKPNTFLCDTKRNRNAELEFSADSTADGLVSTGEPSDCGGVSWDQAVLTRAAKFIDFVIVHQYFVLKQGQVDEAGAQKFSYYQEQVDIRVDLEGVTAMPSQIRKELVQWLPSKKNIPIIVGEFNAGRTDKGTEVQKLNLRNSLFVGLSVGELYLDLLQPVRVKKESLPGADRAILLNLYSLPVLIARYQPLGSADTLVRSPALHVLSMLRDFQGKSIVSAQVANNPKTPVNRGALRTFAVRDGDNVWLAVFNHSSTGVINADIILKGIIPDQASSNTIGENVSSFLEKNSLDNPNLITPVSVQVPSGNIIKNKIKQYAFPAHSLTVIQIAGK